MSELWNIQNKGVEKIDEVADRPMINIKRKPTDIPMAELWTELHADNNNPYTET